MPADPGLASVGARVSSTTPDPDPGNNFLESAMVVSEPPADLLVFASRNFPARVHSLDEPFVRVDVVNYRPLDPAHVTAVAPMPEGVESSAWPRTSPEASHAARPSTVN